MPTTRVAKMSQVSASIAVDHVTVHFALGTVSIHCLRVETDGSRPTGFDHDGVTKADLNIPEDADLLAELTPDRIAAFVSGVEGVAVSIDAPAPPIDDVPVDSAPLPELEPAPQATIGTADTSA